MQPSSLRVLHRRLRLDVEEIAQDIAAGLCVRRDGQPCTAPCYGVEAGQGKK
jgi:hypothetical protein